MTAGKRFLIVLVTPKVRVCLVTQGMNAYQIAAILSKGRYQTQIDWQFLGLQDSIGDSSRLLCGTNTWCFRVGSSLHVEWCIVPQKLAPE